MERINASTGSGGSVSTGTVVSGTVSGSEEGEVFWISREELKDHLCVVDLEKMLEVFDRDDLSEFQYRKKDGRNELRLL